jgi:hypothetical protein
MLEENEECKVAPSQFSAPRKLLQYGEWKGRVESLSMVSARGQKELYTSHALLLANLPCLREMLESGSIEPRDGTRGHAVHVSYSVKLGLTLICMCYAHSTFM